MGSLSYLEAAFAVLDDAAEPVTAHAILAEATKRKLIVPKSKTPERSLSAALYVYAKANPSGRLRRLHQEGSRRAVRGSVRWMLTNDKE